MRMPAVWLLPFFVAACASRSPTQAVPPVDVSGAWQIDATYTMGAAGRVRPLCHFEQSGDSFSGTCKGPTSDGTVEGTVAGNHIKFVWTHFRRPDAIPSSTVNGDDFGGSGRDSQGHSTTRVQFKGQVEQGVLIVGSIERLEYPLAVGSFSAMRP